MSGNNGTVDPQIIYTREEIDIRVQKELASATTSIHIAVEHVDNPLLL